MKSSSFLFTDGQLYTATAADFSGTDPLIYREPVRTGRSDLLLLNDPSFVGSVASTSHAYFFYRETAVEYMNCGKVLSSYIYSLKVFRIYLFPVIHLKMFILFQAVYSRVARICLNDKGGPNRYSDQWMSFLKARMNCSMPGDYPFYFDEIRKFYLYIYV